MKAARRLEPLDPGLARETYLDAWQAALFAGHLAGGGDLEEVSRAARALPPPERPPRAADLLLDGLALLVTDGPAAAAPALREAISAFADPDVHGGRTAPVELDGPGGEPPAVGRRRLAPDRGSAPARPRRRRARPAPILLSVLGGAAVSRGDLAAAASLIAESDAAREATGARLVAYAAMVLAAFRGSQAEAVRRSRPSSSKPRASEAAAVTWAYWVTAVLHNGLGRYQEALVAARQAARHRLVHISMWALPELVEAAACTGNTALALMLSTSCLNGPRLAKPTGDWGSRRGPGRC